MKEQKIIYYSDELNDEFSGTIKNNYVVDENYEYIKKGFIYNFFAFIFYRIILMPIAFVYVKVIKKTKFVNTRVLKSVKSGYFVYANHTNNILDAFCPTLICFPKKTYIIVNSDNINLPVLKRSTRMFGAIPVPSNLTASKNFIYAVEKRIVQRNPVVIYPEAHIWPFYTDIRPYKSTSFKYPVKFDEPSFCFTTTYQKTKKSFRAVIYVDGPFYVNKELFSQKEQQEELRNRIYEQMKQRAKLNNIEVIKYIKRR